MAAEENKPVRVGFFGEGNQPRHLRVVDEDDIGAALFSRSQRTVRREPISLSVPIDPICESLRLAF